MTEGRKTKPEDGEYYEGMMKTGKSCPEFKMFIPSAYMTNSQIKEETLQVQMNHPACEFLPGILHPTVQKENY